MAKAPRKIPSKKTAREAPAKAPQPTARFQAERDAALPIQEIIIGESVWKYLRAARLTVDRTNVRKFSDGVVEEMNRFTREKTAPGYTVRLKVRNQQVVVAVDGTLGDENYGEGRPRRFATAKIPFAALAEAMPVYRESTSHSSEVLRATLTKLREKIGNKVPVPDLQLGPLMELVSEVFPQGPTRVTYPSRPLRNRRRSPAVYWDAGSNL